MDLFFASRIKELKSCCPADFAVYVTTPGEEPGACPIDELDPPRRIMIGKVGDPTDLLYAAWRQTDIKSS